MKSGSDPLNLSTLRSQPPHERETEGETRNNCNKPGETPATVERETANRYREINSPFNPTYLKIYHNVLVFKLGGYSVRNSGHFCEERVLEGAP